MSYSDNEKYRERLRNEHWFDREWKISSRINYTTFSAMEDIASKARKKGFSKKEVFDRLRKDRCNSQSNKSIWSAVYKGFEHYL